MTATTLLLIILLLVLGLNMDRGLNHDEHQFIASGELLAEHGLFPYVDYPYFHVPAQTFVYALLFRLSDHLLLTARVFSVICSWLSLALLFGVAFTALHNQDDTVRLLFAASIVVLLIASQVFTHASGRAWNHDLSILLALGAFVLHTRGLGSNRSYGWPTTSGLLLGLAASTRLSFAPVVAPFLIALWYFQPAERRLPELVAFGLGGLLGTAPALIALGLAPDEFIFGNFTYAQLNTQYFRQMQTESETMSLVGKVIYFFRLVVTEPGNLLLTLPFVGALLPIDRTTGGRHALSKRFALLVLPFLFVGAFAPTPAQPQYFYALFPFMLLMVVYRVAALPNSLQRRNVQALAVVAGIAILLALPLYGSAVQTLVDPDEWFPVKLHERSVHLSDLVDGKHVLTLAPIYPLEGEAGVYAPLTTGSFAWRVAPLLSPERQARYGLVEDARLASFLEQTRRPRAVLVGVHDDDFEAERALVAYAQQHSYVPLHREEVGTLWLAPQAEWEGAIRLGGHAFPRDPVRPGETFVATFYLQNVAPIRENLNVLVRAVGDDGRELFRDEGWPWGAPTSTWQRDDVWPDGHEITIPADAQAGYYRVEMSFYDPDTLEPFGKAVDVAYLRVGDVNVPADRLTPPATLGRQVRLLAAEIDATSYTPGTTVPLDLFWMALSPPERNYTVFVHLVGPDGSLLAQQDRRPLDGVYPMTAWRPHTPIQDRYEVTLPNDAPAGTYTLYAGMYDADSGERLTVERGGAPAGDAIELSTVQVEGGE